MHTWKYGGLRLAAYEELCVCSALRLALSDYSLHLPNL